jgi:hypothetical protein
MLINARGAFYCNVSVCAAWQGIAAMRVGPRWPQRFQNISKVSLVTVYVDFAQGTIALPFFF